MATQTRRLTRDEMEIDDDISDTGSHLDDDDYERDGFVVDDDDASDIESEEGGSIDLSDLSANDRRLMKAKLKEQADQEESAFIRENADKVIKGGRQLRSRKAPKTAEQIYAELNAEIEDHEAELAEIEDELDVFNGKKKFSAAEKKERDSLKKDHAYVKERLQLLVSKVKDLEDDHRVCHGDIDQWEDEKEDLEKLLGDLETQMAKAERAGDEAGYAKLGKKHKTASNKLNKVEAQIERYEADMAYLEAGSSPSPSDEDMSDDDDDGGEEAYSTESDYSESGSDYTDSDYSDEE